MKNLGELKKEVEVVKEERSKVDEGVDMMGKVNSRIGKCVRVKNIMEGEIGVWKMCVDIVGKDEVSWERGERLMGCIGEIL